MTLAAHQPYFLPYFPYWQLIAAADIFIISDDYQYMKHSWINRNYISINGEARYFRVEVAKMSANKLIRDTFLAPIDKDLKLKTLEMAYHKAPCFSEGYALADRILSCPERRLSTFLENSIREVCKYLSINTPMILSSSLEGNSLLRREERVYDFCRRKGADRYINAIGGRSLYSVDEFRKRGIELGFIKSPHGGLSVLDCIMRYPKEQLHDRLAQFEIIR